MRGLEDQWRVGLEPWKLIEEGDRWYGRGTADNKGQHALNIAALKPSSPNAAASSASMKVVLEMAEERGSTGLREFIAANAEELAADVLIASDGPRVEPEIPTIATGTRGTFHFDLVLKLRPAACIPAHWAGLDATGDPARPCAHHHDGPQRQGPGARHPAENPVQLGARCSMAARSAAATVPRRSTKAGANQA